MAPGGWLETPEMGEEGSAPVRLETAMTVGQAGMSWDVRMRLMVMLAGAQGTAGSETESWLAVARKMVGTLTRSGVGKVDVTGQLPALVMVREMDSACALLGLLRVKEKA